MDFNLLSNIRSKIWVDADTFIFPDVLKENTFIGASSTVTKSIMIEGVL